MAPNLGGESFGIILTEAMAAGAAIVASDLDAFARVLDGGRCGRCSRRATPAALTATLDRLLDDPTRGRRWPRRRGRSVERFDWVQVAADVVAVYETVMAGRPDGVIEDDRAGRFARLVGLTGPGHARAPGIGPLRVTDILVSLLVLVVVGFLLELDGGSHRPAARPDRGRARGAGRPTRPALVGGVGARHVRPAGPGGRRAHRRGAHTAREAEPGARDQAESDLSRVLRAALDQVGQCDELTASPRGRLLLDELETASRRVVMARRFHNDAVRATRAVRHKRHVRYLRLAGHAAMPDTFEFDDAPPDCLAREI